jgi:hypothetical protein
MTPDTLPDTVFTILLIWVITPDIGEKMEDLTASIVDVTDEKIPPTPLRGPLSIFDRPAGLSAEVLLAAGLRNIARMSAWVLKFLGTLRDRISFAGAFFGISAGMVS